LACRYGRPYTPRGARRGARTAGKAVSDPSWQAASHALDELLRKQLVVARLLEAEERLAKDDEERRLPAAVGYGTSGLE
jgi:hypothetical protein